MEKNKVDTGFSPQTYIQKLYTPEFSILGLKYICTYV